MIKSIFTFAFILVGITFMFGQNEQSPIVEKDITYKNWSYKNVLTGNKIDLRDFARGKKLVIVAYFAPWCPNWRQDAPILQRLHEKYKSDGLGIIGIGEYDPVDAVKINIDTLKITFPVVYESESRDNRTYTLHYGYRQSTGDTRKWGSPWYIFLEPSNLEKTGEVLLKKANVINGEIIEAEGEKFIRQKLGLPAEELKTAQTKSADIKACEPEKKTTPLKRPQK